MKNIILLHGALGSAAGWHHVANEFYPDGRVFIPDLPGHGNNGSVLPKTSLTTLVDFLKGFIKENVHGEYVIVGYSMGGYMALKFAVQQPESLKGIITIATKFDWNEEIAAHAAANLTKENLNGIWEKLAEEHAGNAERILETTQQILLSVGDQPLTQTDLAQIIVPVKILLGDRDTIVAYEETKLFGSFIPDAETDLLVNQPHLLQKMDASVLKNVLQKYIDALFR
jgi:pimeloyl-ACP methyl ester carboxylesterase